jgi:hypothetical protein
LNHDKKIVDIGGGHGNCRNAAAGDGAIAVGLGTGILLYQRVGKQAKW